MRFSLKHGAALAEVGDATLPDVTLRRGLQVGRTGVAAQAGSLSCTMDARRVALEEALQLEETTGAGTRLWSGTIFDIEQTVDRGLNQLRYRVRAEGPMRRLINAEAGASTALMTNVSVDEAIEALLDAAGVPAAEYDIGPSPRMLALWWLSNTQSPWAQLQTLVRTAGPRARLYEDQMGRIAFRDAALPVTPVRTLTGRLATPITSERISRLERHTDGAERIVNSVSLERRDASSIPEVIGVVSRTASVNSGQVVSIIAQSFLDAAGAEDGDLLLVWYTMGLSGSSSGLTVTALGNGFNVISNQYAARLCWLRYPAAPRIDGNASGRAKRAHMTVVIVRNAAAPTVTGSGASWTNESAADSTIPVPTLVAPNNSLGLAFAQGMDANALETLVGPGGWDLLDQTAVGSQTTIYPNVAEQDFPVGAASLSGSWSFSNTNADTGRVGMAATVALTAEPSVVWTHDGTITLSANQAQSFLAEASQLYIDPITPTEAAGDFTVVTGSVTATLAATPNSVYSTVTLTAGAQGATVTNLRLRATLVGDDPAEPVTASDNASIARYRRRNYTGDVWDFLSEAEAQDLADEIVAESAHPRASWQVVLDGDRDAPTMAACLESEIGDPVQTNLDAEFNQLGEVVGIDHKISGPATLLQTRLTMLAAEALLPPAHRLYLGSIANPLFLGSAANPLELR